VVLTLVCAVLSACSLQVEESDVAGVYVAHFKSGSEKLQLQRDGSFVQQVLVQGVETRSFGTWTYERTDGVVAVIHLTDCLAVSDGFGDIRAGFATQQGGCRFPVRLGPEMPSALRKIELSRAERRDLQTVALDLKDAIVKHDVERILRHVDNRTGLSCTDTEIPYTEIRRDLRDPESHLFQSLFETTRRLRRCGHEYRSEYPAISDAEFFRNATNAHVEIALVDVLPESGELWATATFHSSHMRHAAREWSFSRVGDRWLLGRGLIVSRCSCG